MSVLVHCLTFYFLKLLLLGSHQCLEQSAQVVAPLCVFAVIFLVRMTQAKNEFVSI